MAESFRDRIHWSEKTVSLSALLQRSGVRFPIIAVTSCGFHGTNEAEVISSEEIFRIQSVTSQWRVFAVDARGRIFSLPLTRREKFVTVGQHGKKSKPKGLDEIVVDCELPVKVSFAKDTDHFEIGEMKYSNAKLGILTLYKFYEERFLCLNTIARGVINKRSLLLPLYVQVEVNVAKGFKDGSAEEWNSLMTMYDKAVNPAKISFAGGLDDVLIYDPSEGKIINPQAIHDRSRYILADNTMPTGILDSQIRHDTLAGRMSYMRITDNLESDRSNGISDYPDNGKGPANGRQRRNEGVQHDIEKTGLEEDESYDARTLNERNHQKNISATPRPDSPENHSAKKSKTRIDDESPKMKTKSKKTVEGSEDFEMDAHRRSSDEQQNNSKREEDEREPNMQTEDQPNRTKPLETPIPAKRRTAPTGKVSPMVRESSNKGEKVDDSNGVTIIDSVKTEQSTQFTEFVSVKSDYSTWPNSTAEQHSTGNAILSQSTERPGGRYGAHVETKSTNELENNILNQSIGFSVSSERYGHGQAKSKKSALKADWKKPNRAKRHVSYSDTDTVYPFDSYDDMADDSELDSPFRRDAAEIFADSLKNRTSVSQIRNPLAFRKRQRGSLVVNVHPGRVQRNHTTNLYPTMPRRQFYESDSSILSKTNGSSFRQSGIEVIPETAEDYAAFSGPGNRSKQYFEVSNFRDLDFDNQRRNASSVISLGNARYDSSINRPANRQPYIVDGKVTRSYSNVASFEPNLATLNNGTARHRAHNGATHQHRQTVLEWTHEDNPPNEYLARKHEGRTPNGAGKNGFLLQPEYRHRVGNYAEENPKNFSSKVIRLNETRDGNKWAEISDVERMRGLEANHLVYSGATTRRSKDINYFTSSAANNRSSQHHSSSTGIVPSVTVNGISPLTPRTTHNSTYAATRETGSNHTLPWNPRYNNTASKRTIITSSNSPATDRNRLM